VHRAAGGARRRGARRRERLIARGDHEVSRAARHRDAMAVVSDSIHFQQHPTVKCVFTKMIFEQHCSAGNT
jgi:hypothetical protein